MRKPVKNYINNLKKSESIDIILNANMYKAKQDKIINDIIGN